LLLVGTLNIFKAKRTAVECRKSLRCEHNSQNFWPAARLLLTAKAAKGEKNYFHPVTFRGFGGEA
jgi:hypothetical protein